MKTKEEIYIDSVKKLNLYKEPINGLTNKDIKAVVFMSIDESISQYKEEVERLKDKSYQLAEALEKALLLCNNFSVKTYLENVLNNYKNK